MKKVKFSLRMLAMSFAIVSIFILMSCGKAEIQSTLNSDGSKISGLKAGTSGQITLSGSTWTGKVDGAVVYTGTDMFAAANTCIANMSSGTLTIANSGSSGASGGAVKAIKLTNNITVDGGNHTITGNSGDDLIVPILADRKSNVAVKNLIIAGRVRYGIWFQGCNGMNVQNCKVTAACLCPAFRFDNSTASASNLTVGTVTASGSTADQSMGLETYGINGLTISSVTATNMGACGICLNGCTGTQTVGTCTATSCDYGGGYAGFRCANTNGPVKVGTVTSNKCGRGFFSCTNSNGTTISTLNADGCSSHGILMENCVNSQVLSGHIHNCGGDAGIRFSQTTNHNLVKGLDISGVAKGVNETSPGDYNTVQNCNVHGTGITLTGSHSVSTGNTL